jgi:hypothetical protein
MIAAAAAVAIPVHASPEYIYPRLELIYGKQTDLDDAASAADADAQPNSESEDYFRLTAGVKAGWADGFELGAALLSQGLQDDPRYGDRSETGISEAYLSAENIGFTPLSAILGRQALLKGRGLLLGDDDTQWRFDAADMRYSAFSSALALTLARTVRLSTATDIEQLGLIAVKYEFATPYIRELELYGGAVESYSGETLFPGGARLELRLSPEIELWSEAVAETGRNPRGGQVEAWLADLGIEYRPTGAAWSPAATLRGTLASGASGESESDFVPLMDSGVGGVALRPYLSNIQVWQLGLECRPQERMTLACDLYHYRRLQAESGVAGREDWLYDSLSLPADDSSRELAWELDLAASLELRPELSLELTGAYLLLGQAYDYSGEDDLLKFRMELKWSY